MNRVPRLSPVPSHPPRVRDPWDKDLYFIHDPPQYVPRSVTQHTHDAPSAGFGLLEMPQKATRRASVNLKKRKGEAW